MYTILSCRLLAVFVSLDSWKFGNLVTCCENLVSHPVSHPHQAMTAHRNLMISLDLLYSPFYTVDFDGLHVVPRTRNVKPRQVERCNTANILRAVLNKIIESECNACFLSTSAASILGISLWVGFSFSAHLI